MRRIIRLTAALAAAGLITFGGVGLTTGASATEACIPQDATETTYKWIDNPDYQPAVEGVHHDAVTHEEEGDAPWWNWSPDDTKGPQDYTPDFPNDERGTWHLHSTGGPEKDSYGTFNVSNGGSGNSSWFHREHGEVVVVVDHEAYDEPGTPAVGEPQIKVVDVEGHDAVTCDEPSWTPTYTTPPSDEPTDEPTDNPTDEPTIPQHVSVTICHATGAEDHWTNPTVDDDSILNEQHEPLGNGHAAHQDGRDIIPAFTTTDGFEYPGLNLDTMYGDATGQQVLDNGCEIPTPEPTPTPTPTPTVTPVPALFDFPTTTPTCEDAESFDDAFFPYQGNGFVLTVDRNYDGPGPYTLTATADEGFEFTEDSPGVGDSQVRTLVVTLDGANVELCEPEPTPTPTEPTDEPTPTPTDEPTPTPTDSTPAPTPSESTPVTVPVDNPAPPTSTYYPPLAQTGSDGAAMLALVAGLTLALGLGAARVARRRH